MDKEKFTELTHLFFMEELSEDEKQSLLSIIESSPELKSEFESIKKMYKAFGEAKPKFFNENELIKSRQELLRTIRKERLKPTFADRLFSFIDSIRMSGVKLASSGAFVMLIGFFAGYLVFNPSIETLVENNPNEVVSVDQVLSSGVDINNIRLQENPASEGQVTITFQAAKPYTYTGGIEDKTVQRLLANLITTSENPGMRIQSVNKLSVKMESDFIPDPEVKSALITSLKKDDNVGVRKSALETLVKYKFDEDIRDALLFVLNNDQNSGLRILAINSLAELKLEGLEFDNTLKTELNKKVKEEPNLFIKNLAESLLMGEDI
jgi:hypothetical protein